MRFLRSVCNKSQVPKSMVLNSSKVVFIKLLFHGSVQSLGFVEFLGKESDRCFVLSDYRAQLIIGSIGFDYKRFVMVGVAQKKVLNNEGLNLVEGFL